MGKDNRRIAAPDNCVSPLAFKVQKIKKIADAKPRADGRAFDDLRPISLKVGIVPGVTGSAYLECGKTKIICSVNGPRDVLHKSDSAVKGQLLCEFKYATFSCKERQPYLPSNEESNISKDIQDALEPVILLHKFPKSRLDISIIVLENDGGAVSAAITCAGAALSNAGVEIYDLPIGCHLIGNKDFYIIDPTYEEEMCLKMGSFGIMTTAMMPAYNSQVIYKESFGSLPVPFLSKGLKILLSASQRILDDIRECLKQHIEPNSSYDAAMDTDDSPLTKVKATELKLFQPQKYISAFLENDIRPDGRKLKEFRSVLINIGSIETANGSALVKLGETSVLCGIKADLTNPSSDEPNKGFFVPNITMTSVCSNRFLPGPPSEQAQVFSQMIMDLWKNSSFLPATSLCIAEKKLSWCLFAEIICLSYDGNIFDACVLALMAALKNTKLPEVLIKEEMIEVRDNLIQLKMNDYVFSASYAILESSAIADPSSEEENLGDGSLTVLLAKDRAISVQSFGRVKEELIFECINCSLKRYHTMKSVVNALN